MERREALAGVASALAVAGCLRFEGVQTAGGTTRREAGGRPGTATASETTARGSTEVADDPGTATSEPEEAETDTAESEPRGPPVTGVSRSFAYDAANSGFYAVDGPTSAPTEVWTRSFSRSVRTVPALVDGTLFVAADGLAALDARTGREAWSTYRAGRVSPSVVDGVVYGAGEDRIGAFDAASGTNRWLAVAERPNGVTVDDGVVVAGTENGVVALDAASGDDEWRALADVSIDTAPAIVDGTVYVADRPRDRPAKVYAFDLTSGRRQWTYQISETDGSGAHYYVIGEPAYADGALYVPCENRTVYAIDAASGTERWQKTLFGGMNPAPAVAGDTVYVGQDGGRVTALDVANGERRWKGDENTGSIVSNVVATSASVFAVDDSGLLVAYERDSGSTRYELGLSRSRTRCGPLVTDDWIFVGDGDGTLHAFATTA